MPTLAELKAKWFIRTDSDQTVLGVPCRRHSPGATGTQLAVSTDNNTVMPLIDGAAYMERWHTLLGTLHGQPGAEFMHAGWRFEGVKTLGHSVPGTDALQDVAAAQAAGVAVYPVMCRNLLMLRFNNATVIWLHAHGVWNAVMDNRFPAGGSNHQKFAVFKRTGMARAIMGSIDISKTRWDRPVHNPTDPDRHPSGKPTHDTGVLLIGPASRDVELTFRERWNDPTRTFGLEPLLPPLPLISSPLSAEPGTGTHSVQILRTYGITNATFGYSWHARGEFTVWASYLNAIRTAQSLIYIEDQYFLPWGFPPRFAATGARRDVDVVYQLGEAMKRGVKVVVVVPANEEDSTHAYQKYQRDLAVNYLTGVKAAGASGDVVVASLKNGTTDIYVHSKLMLVDDELVLIGSTNVGQRSMTHDGEIHAAIVDSANSFARELRKTLWAEHTGRPAATLDAPLAAYALFVADTAASAGHLKPYPVDPPVVYPPVAGTPPPGRTHSHVINHLVDPYAGPAALA